MIDVGLDDIGPDRRVGALALQRDLAAAEHIDAIAHLDGCQRVLLDEQDRNAFVAQCCESVEDPLDKDRREAKGGFVHEQELRAGEKGAGDCKLLLLAAGEIPAA